MWRQGSFQTWFTELQRRFGDEAADVRHEIFYLSAGRGVFVASLKALSALIRDIWLLMRSPGNRLEDEGHEAILLATLGGGNGWGTLARSLPVLAAVGLKATILAHPRVPDSVFPPRLQIVRPARPDVGMLTSALGVLVGALRSRNPFLLACCLARRSLWRDSLKKTLGSGCRVLLLHNDFDLMSRAAIGQGAPSICLQHGVPTDEFFPARADWYLIWGGSCRQAFVAADSPSVRLVEDDLGRGTMPSEALMAPVGLALLSQTHARILGKDIHRCLRDFAETLLQLAPQTRILLHPQEDRPYRGAAADAARRPPHPELQTGACPAVMVLGYCSTAMLDAALAGHWVVGLLLPLEGNQAARTVLSTPLQVETAQEAVALYRRLREDAVFRTQAAKAQADWLKATFCNERGGLAALLVRVGQGPVVEAVQ